MLNHTVLMGRLTRTPDLKSTASGAAYVQFSLAVERDFKDKQTGEKVTDFIDFVAWSHTAEFICKYFGKGRMMVVSGRIQTDTFTDKDGNKRRSFKVVAENVYFGDSKSEAGVPAAGAPVMADAGVGDYQMLEEEDGELPF